MELVCQSKHLDIAYYTALDTAGREHLVIISKATWRIPEPGQRPRPLPPCPLVVSDEYYGAPGESAMRYGDDFVRYKPRCDLLFDACAHAPDQKPVAQLTTEVRIGDWYKTICVTGNRHWQKKGRNLVPSRPEPFTTMPLHYGHAFGGTRPYQENGQTLHEAHGDNLAGIGWGGEKTWRDLAGEPIANPRTHELLSIRPVPCLHESTAATGWPGSHSLCQLHPCLKNHQGNPQGFYQGKNSCH